MLKSINGHTYEVFYRGQGVIAFCIDFNDYYDIESAAEALGLTIEEFKEVLKIHP